MADILARRATLITPDAIELAGIVLDVNWTQFEGLEEEVLIASVNWIVIAVGVVLSSIVSLASALIEFNISTSNLDLITEVITALDPVEVLIVTVLAAVDGAV